MSLPSSKLFPRLKSGLFAWRTSTGQVRVGSRFQFTSLPSEISGIPIYPFITALDGRSVRALSEALLLEEERINNVLKVLEQFGLIDSEIRPIPYLARYNSETGKNEEVTDAESLPSDPALAGYLTRFAIEAEAATHLSGIRDGGRSSLVNRRTFAISIHGNDRLAFELFGTLIASGFSNTRMIHPPTQRSRSHRVEAQDLIGGFLRPGDLEISKRVAVAELERSSLFNFEIDSPIAAELLIYTRTPRAEEIQELMSKEVAHLLIDNVSAGQVCVGPIVIPGKTPCFRCVRLYEQDWLGVQKSDEKRPAEMAAALAHLIAGVITSDLIRYSYDQVSRFNNKIWSYQIGGDEDLPARNIRIHPSCGCAWGHFKSRNP